ncbi:hypothetical protein K3495_g7798 [Podosphaera aphanis]|nr:hypothetical protein K3495_g7798 [Podosphaera aphanis]
MEFRHAKTGSLTIPLPSLINGGLPPPSATAGVPTTMGRFDDSRSPPGRQNTSHVPCKFFRTGACQAGNSCPFSHDLASTTDNICKYFAKGNCKFGPKCANIHVLPDGRRVNYTKSMTAAHLNVGSRVNTDHFHTHKPSSTLSNSFVRSNGLPPPYAQQFTCLRDEALPIRRQSSIDISVIGFDASYGSIPGSSGDEDKSRYGLGLSPATNKPVNFLDVPLPSSYDSSSISWMAHNNNMMASSVPSKLGLEPSPETVRARDGRSYEALKNLQHSVFGEELPTRAASQPTLLAEDYLGIRSLSLHQPHKRGPIITNTYQAVDRDWDANFTFEEDYLPETLKDLMTPQEKARRGSRNADEEGRFFSCTTTTSKNDPLSKFGSPSNASPSRWGPLFQRQQQKEDDDYARVSAFGHVGSPLVMLSTSRHG